MYSFLVAPWIAYQWQIKFSFSVKSFQSWIVWIPFWVNSFLLPTKDGKRSHVDFWLGQSPGTQDRWKENPSWIQSERKGDFFVDSSGIAVISREAPVWRRRGICHTTFRLLRTCTLLHLWKTLGHYGWMKSFYSVSWFFHLLPFDGRRELFL